MPLPQTKRAKEKASKHQHKKQTNKAHIAATRFQAAPSGLALALYTTHSENTSHPHYPNSIADGSGSASGSAQRAAVQQDGRKGGVLAAAPLPRQGAGSEDACAGVSQGPHVISGGGGGAHVCAAGGSGAASGEEGLERGVGGVASQVGVKRKWSRFSTSVRFSASARPAASGGGERGGASHGRGGASGHDKQGVTSEQAMPGDLGGEHKIRTRPKFAM